MLKDCPVTIALAFAVIITLPVKEVKLDPVTSATDTASTSPTTGVNADPVTSTLAFASVSSLPTIRVKLEPVTA
jgi:uncharacterized membrane protein